MGPGPVIFPTPEPVTPDMNSETFKLDDCYPEIFTIDNCTTDDL